MKNIKKIKLTKLSFLVLSPLFIIVLFVLLLKDFYYRPIRCVAEMKYVDSNPNNIKIECYLRMNYIFKIDSTGILDILGTAVYGDEIFRIKRSADFKIIKTDNNDVYKINYKFLEKNTRNLQLPNILKGVFFSSKLEDHSSYLRISKINDNTYIINDLIQPITICQKY